MAGERKRGPEAAERDPAYVEDIVDSATRIRRHVAGATFEAFSADELLQDAVLRRLTVIGEAAACLSEAFKLSNAGVSWRNVVGFQNVLVHRCWTVDLEIVWSIIVGEIPILIEHLSPRSGA